MVQILNKGKSKISVEMTLRTIQIRKFYIFAGAHFWGIDESGRFIGNKEEAGKYEKEIEEGDSLVSSICFIIHLHLSCFHYPVFIIRPDSLTEFRDK